MIGSFEMSRSRGSVSTPRDLWMRTEKVSDDCGGVIRVKMPLGTSFSVSQAAGSGVDDAVRLDCDKDVASECARPEECLLRQL